MAKISVAGGALQVDAALAAVVEEIAPTAGVDAAAFWAATADLISEFAPRNRVRAQTAGCSAAAPRARPSSFRA